MFRNFSVIPKFGDTTEYLELSQTFKLDEYRPILYPLFLHIVLKIAHFYSVKHYEWFIYSIQTVVNLLATYFAVNSIANVLNRQEGKAKRKILIIKLFITAYVISIPMITWLNFSVLTDSLALSALLIYGYALDAGN
jgi:hypothetical protein